jgi:RND family efflux transporter MFP subunit
VPRRCLFVRALRFLVPLAGAVAPVGCSHAAASSLAPVATAPSLLEPQHVEWAIAVERLLPDRLAVTGDLRADAAIDLCCETEGRVVRAAMERGQLVQEGQLVVELDGRDAAFRLAEAEAVQAQIEARLGDALHGPFDPEQTPDVRLARVNLERARTEAGRYERLVADGAVARSLHDVELANHAVARERHAAEVDRMREQHGALQAQRARVASARKTVDDTSVRAPWSGAVLARHVDVGQYVRKGDRLASLVRVDSLRVALAVPESHAAAVRPGQRVQLEVRARIGEAFAGVVAHVAPGLDAASRALTVELVVDNADRRLQPGSFVTAGIELPASRPSVVVTRAAVVAADGAHHVLVVDGGRARKRFVQLGRDLGDEVEVLRGLAAGEKVVLQQDARVADGAIVAAAAAQE